MIIRNQKKMIAYQRIILFLVILHLAQHRCASAANFLLAWFWSRSMVLVQVSNFTRRSGTQCHGNRFSLFWEKSNSAHTIDEYHKPLYSPLKRLSPKDRVILVGHSYGGFPVSSAMKMFPFQLRADDSGDSKTIGDPPTIVLFGPKDLATTMYQSSPKEDYKLANYSIRVTKFFYDEVSQKQLLVSRERYGSVSRAYIIAGSDAGSPPDDQRFFIESNPPDVVKEIAGADHMAMFSKPQDLANNLQEIALRFTV